MAKKVYGVPASLNRSMLDKELPMDVFGEQKIISVKSLLFFVVGGFVIMWSLTSTFMKEAPLWLQAVFVLYCLAFIAFFGRTTSAQELKIEQVASLLEYIPKQLRYIPTRMSSQARELRYIFGIKNITDDGEIEFNDGRFGYAYLVVGSASRLLFEDDRNAIIDRVDAFWRKIDTDVEIASITVKEPQRVFHQIAELERLNRALEVRHPDMLDLIDERYDILNGFVGKEFKSLHQYQVVMAPSREALRLTHNLLAAEVHDSNLMLKSCTKLDKTDIIDMLSTFFRERG